MSKRLGIIQSRGLGDIIIALPIALHYREQGYHVHWPIAEQFIAHVEQHVPWVKWIPLTVDPGAYFYDTPYQRLRNFGCDPIVCLYQALTNHPELSARPEFQIMKFDQIKYAEVGIPFRDKWRLPECVSRNTEAEQALALSVNPEGRPYVIIHLEGSDHRAEFDRSIIPSEYLQIDVSTQTESIFNWLGLLEGAEALVCVDSVMANLADQYSIPTRVDSYFIPRSHIQLTPVLNGPWTTLEPDLATQQRIRIFR